MREALSPIEREVYHFLLDFLSDHTFQPSVREIAARLRIASTKSVADLLASLERKGYVEREPGRSRGVTLVGFAGGAGTIPVPILRFDVAGSGAPGADDHVTLDRRLVPSDESFLLRAEDEPAPAHGVRLGDLVLVEPSARATDGDVVVVRAAGAVLVRAMRRRGTILLLEAPLAGRDLELGPDDDYSVLGLLAGVIRSSAFSAGPAASPSAHDARSATE
jgi:repressor LexA